MSGEAGKIKIANNYAEVYGCVLARYDCVMIVRGDVEVRHNVVGVSAVFIIGTGTTLELYDGVRCLSLSPRSLSLSPPLALPPHLPSLLGSHAMCTLAQPSLQSAK